MLRYRNDRLREYDVSVYIRYVSHIYARFTINTLQKQQQLAHFVIRLIKYFE